MHNKEERETAHRELTENSITQHNKLQHIVIQELKVQLADTKIYVIAPPRTKTFCFGLSLPAISWVYMLYALRLVRMRSRLQEQRAWQLKFIALGSPARD